MLVDVHCLPLCRRCGYIILMMLIGACRMVGVGYEGLLLNYSVSNTRCCDWRIVWNESMNVKTARADLNHLCCPARCYQDELKPISDNAP